MKRLADLAIEKDAKQDGISVSAWLRRVALKIASTVTVTMMSVLVGGMIGCGGIGFNPCDEISKWNGGQGMQEVRTAADWWREMIPIVIGTGTPLHAQHWHTGRIFVAAGDAEFIDFDLDWWDAWKVSNPEYVQMIDDVIAHEMGHALGLSHVRDPNAVMYADVHPGLGLTESDKREFERVRYPH